MPAYRVQFKLKNDPAVRERIIKAESSGAVVAMLEKNGYFVISVASTDGSDEKAAAVADPAKTAAPQDAPAFCSTCRIPYPTSESECPMCRLEREKEAALHAAVASIGRRKALKNRKKSPDYGFIVAVTLAVVACVAIAVAAVLYVSKQRAKSRNVSGPPILTPASPKPASPRPVSRA